MIALLNFNFRHKNKVYSPPLNYKEIDKFVSRSAQPFQDEFVWLKNQGVTDVVNFRKPYEGMMQHDEEKILRKLKMNYHSIPTGPKAIGEYAVEKFFDIVNEVRNSGGSRKLHIHCQAGADRTGFFSLLYKGLYNIDTIENNIKEMIKMGHNQLFYPNLIESAKDFLSKLKINTLRP